MRITYTKLHFQKAKMPGIELLAQLRQHGINVPVVFLAEEVIARDHSDQCLLAPPDSLDAYEWMASDQGATDFIAKSRDRRVLVRRLRRVVELIKPKTDVSVEERVACGKLRLNPETSRTYWNQVDVGLTLGDIKPLTQDLITVLLSVVTEGSR